MRKISIDEAYCKGCNLCMTVCLQEALVKGSKRSQKGYLMPDSVAEKCTACRNCEVVCPDFAISIEEVN
ncbi:MAG: 4Fe-4S dicluster domain-containing protein [Desulfitobacteriaceae bacterium]